MHPDLEQAISFHESIVAEGSKALVGYDTAKALANVVQRDGLFEVRMHQMGVTSYLIEYR